MFLRTKTKSGQSNPNDGVTLATIIFQNMKRLQYIYPIYFYNSVKVTLKSSFTNHNINSNPFHILSVSKNVVKSGQSNPGLRY